MRDSPNMESIDETPAKKRKLGNGVSGKGYDSQEDSGDDIFEAYDTVETVPLPRKSTQPSTWIPSQQVTQPTQLTHHGLSRATKAENEKLSSVIQVNASSPTTSTITSPTRKLRTVASSTLGTMAPAGTVYRPPSGIIKAPPAPMTTKPPIIDISDDDDGPQYRGGSSEEEPPLMKADIRPSSFITQAPKVKNSNGDRFKDIISKAVCNPYELSKSQENIMPIRSSDTMANAYGGGGRKPRSTISQVSVATVPQASRVLVKDIPITSIQDYQMRDKIRRMITVFPSKSVLQCRDALFEKRNNYDDAMEYLLEREESATVDLTADDDRADIQQMSFGRVRLPKKSAAKQHIKAPIQKIHEKWTSTPTLLKTGSLSSQPQALPKPPVSKPRRRLVQGRKTLSTPVEALRSSSSTPRSTTPEPEDFDSGLGEGSKARGLETRVLGFFNTCSASDLADIAAIPSATAHALLSQKPFTSLPDIRKISGLQPTNTKPRKARLIGDRIVDRCLEMWAGYEAVDELVHHCKQLARPLEAAMAKWGIDIYGSASRDGVLEIVDIDTFSSGAKDSGIGTPTSRSISMDEDTDGDTVNSTSTRKQTFFGQPSNMATGVVLKDYQVVGINWLSLLFDQGQSLSNEFGAILADDMGLGKTCQVIAFLAHLSQEGIKGPHLIVVPGSTLENWLREFREFCPELDVRPYYANQNERPEIREHIENDREVINVIITTYTIAKMKEDNKFLRKLRPVCCVYDEGHMLRNSKAAGYEAYMRITARFRLLLTGTPLQNNLRELVSLLGFILPSVFNEHSEDLAAIFSHKAKTTDTDESHAALLSTERIARAKSMMAPFVLRRKKHQVLKQLPSKYRRVEYCELSKPQVDLYRREKNRSLEVFAKRRAGESNGNDSANIMMALRKASLHPLLFRRLFDDNTIDQMAKACLSEDEFRDSNVDLVYEDMTVMDDIELHLFCERYPKSMSKFALQDEQWMDSGKVKALSQLLQTYKRNGDRVLVFSQFVMVMNVLELVMETLDMQFFRLDGQTKIQERQTMIDEFYQDPDITVFLLSTKAGGSGINLACANKVIIFDSSFNPQDDIQAENRAHRVGQTRDVEVVRLVTKGTIEEQIHALGETKLALDARVADNIDHVDEAKAENLGKKMVEEMLISDLAHDAVTTEAE